MSLEFRQCMSIFCINSLVLLSNHSQSLCAAHHPGICITIEMILSYLIVNSWSVEAAMYASLVISSSSSTGFSNSQISPVVAFTHPSSTRSQIKLTPLSVAVAIFSADRARDYPNPRPPHTKLDFVSNQGKDSSC